jgi:hypothetical protein
MPIRSGNKAKPLPAAKADLGPLFDFQHGKKSSMYRSGYICGFSPHSKIKYQPYLHFLATGSKEARAFVSPPKAQSSHYRLVLTEVCESIRNGS